MRRIRQFARRSWLFPLVVAVTFVSCARSVSPTTDDASITARARTVLMNDAEIDALNIDVTTSSGVVTLSGVVRSSVERNRALDLIRRVEGVREVKSSLQVSTSGG
jgi:hyperosmotically inducible periplasmic protein